MWRAFAAFVPQEADLIRLKREAKAKGGFYVEPEAKVVFVVSGAVLVLAAPSSRCLSPLPLFCSS